MGIFYVMPPDEESFFQGYNDSNFLQELYYHIGCSTVEMRMIRHDVSMWMDEDGNLKGSRRNIPATLAVSRVYGYLVPIVGTVVFTGCKNNNKETYLPADFHDMVADSLMVRLR